MYLSCKDVATRWGTKQKLVERVLRQLPAIRRVLIDDRKHGHLNPTWQDVAILESIDAALKPVAEFTDVMSGEKYVTVSSVKPVLELLKGDLSAQPIVNTILSFVNTIFLFCTAFSFFLYIYFFPLHIYCIVPCFIL